MKIRDAGRGDVSPCLLDVNVLIALIDSVHVFHHQAHRWFADVGHEAWASCPMTQNGVLRVVGHPGYHNYTGAPAAVAEALQGLCALPGHVFWPDDISLLDAGRIDRARLLEAGQVTDTYLLALAVRHGGRLATFDRRLVADAVKGGREALHLIA
jgi:uncharacterized protein